MNRMLAIALVLASTLIAAGTSSAQEHRVKVTVPFYFTIGDFTVPAGTYMIDSAASSPDVLVLREPDERHQDRRHGPAQSRQSAGTLRAGVPQVWRPVLPQPDSLRRRVDQCQLFEYQGGEAGAGARGRGGALWSTIPS